MKTNKLNFLFGLVFLLSFYSCKRIDKNSTYIIERTGHVVDGGGLCYSIEFDGDNDWFYFMPKPLTLPYGKLVGENEYGKFYNHYEYSWYTIPKMVKEECTIIITSNSKGWIKWEKK